MVDLLSRLLKRDGPSPTEIGGSTSMKDLIERIAKSLVDKPEEVSVREVQAENTIAIELRVAAEDRGKVIGKKGRTAEAMRTILIAAGTKLGKRYILEIID